MGQLAFAEADYPSARSHFERADALALDLDRQSSTINLARTYRVLKEFERFEALIVPIAQAHPEWIEVQREIGDYWLTHGQVAQALAPFERIVAQEPADPIAWRALVRAHLMLQQPEQALLRLQAAPVGTVNYRFRLRLEHDGLKLPTESRGSDGANGL